MKKPTIEKVLEYMAKQGGSKLLGEKFFFHYEANGWRVGKNLMKSWQAAICYWVRNEKGSTPQVKVVPKTLPNIEDSQQIERAYAKQKIEAQFQRANNLDGNKDSKIKFLLSQGKNAYQVAAETGASIGRIRVLKSKM